MTELEHLTIGSQSLITMTRAAKFGLICCKQARDNTHWNLSVHLILYIIIRYWWSRILILMALLMLISSHLSPFINFSLQAGVIWDPSMIIRWSFCGKLSCWCHVLCQLDEYAPSMSPFWYWLYNWKRKGRKRENKLPSAHCSLPYKLVTSWLIAWLSILKNKVLCHDLRASYVRWAKLLY